MNPKSCFHCGEPIPQGVDHQLVIDGAPRSFCCTGCEAVASLISENGLENFYRFRKGASTRPEDDAEDQWSVFDRPAAQQGFVRPHGDEREAALVIENISCAACSWLIEHTLRSLPGVTDVQVNPASARALVRWREGEVALSLILRTLARLGYRPHPAGAGDAQAAHTRERRAALKRLAVAGMGMMQAMMYGVGLYTGAFHGIEPIYEQFLRLVSALVATPVLVYAGRPFFVGALRDLKARRPGMDVPVALALSIAYTASVWNTLTHGAEVYFDSVAMFIFFLSLGRFAEMSARHRASQSTDALSQLMPATAHRRRGEALEQVAVAELEPGDRVLIRAGEVVPADGTVRVGASRLDESMLTGESEPRARALGDKVIAGSLNVSQPIEIEVEQVGSDTVLSAIGRLLDRAQSERPRVAQLADYVAGRFIAALLLIAGGVSAWWWQHDPTQVLPVLLAVLVVSCPCALSLATPTALVAATGRLARSGILVTRGNALETATKLTHVVFDKTGTLTLGRITISRTETVGAVSDAEALALASALERHSEHPIGRAFNSDPDPRIEAVETITGSGLEGRLDGRRVRIGRGDFVAELSGTTIPTERSSWVALGDEDGILAFFELRDTPRPEAAEAVAALRAQGIQVEIASGDAEAPVAALAAELGIPSYRSRMRPEDKLARIRELQAQGAVVAMVGDGINDAPVLAGADVSIALGSGSALAHSSAALILMSESLAPLPEVLSFARRTRRIIRQNLGWALLYNASAIPIAATGVVTPWMAAIGMSLSSLLVVMNALRLKEPQRREAASCSLPARAEETPA